MKRVWMAWVACVAAGVLLLAASHVLGPETAPLLGLTQYLPFPAYLGPALLACVGSLWLGWWWRGIAVLSLGLCLTVLMGLAWGHADEGHGRVRFMTYNIKAYMALHRPGGVAELAQEVVEQQPDILVMQDAGQLMDEAEPGAQPLREVLKRHQIYHFGQYGVASRWPLKDCEVGGIGTLKRSHGFVRCTVTVEGVSLSVVTVHLVTPRDGLNATREEGMDGLQAWQDNMSERLAQAGVLAEHLRQAPRPLVVAGDLNAPETSVVVQTLLHTGLRDAFSSAGKGYGFTHGHSLLRGWGLSFLRIDHILVSDDIGVADAWSGGRIGSQHRPVVADLLLHRQ